MRTVGSVLFASIMALAATACVATHSSVSRAGRPHETTEPATSSSFVGVVPTTAELLAPPRQPATCSDVAVGPVSFSDPRFDRVTEISNQLKARGVVGFYVGLGASCGVTVVAGDLPVDIVDWLRALRPPVTLELGQQVRAL